jgi:hypothetical protein
MAATVEYLSALVVALLINTADAGHQGNRMSVSWPGSDGFGSEKLDRNQSTDATLGYDPCSIRDTLPCER